jgi:hypothetical protein
MLSNETRTGADLLPGVVPDVGETKVEVKREAARLDLAPLERAILQAVGYADVFDFPLTAAEIWRNLVEVAAGEEEVLAVLNSHRLVPGQLIAQEGYYMLPGRSGLVELRRRRAVASSQLWPRAHHYGRLIAALPFVRMVAVTGALAVNNSGPGDDIDYLVVTEPGRLWLARAFTILLVKRAARRGDLICPNYFISDQALALPERDLFTAHELAQMAPLAGFDVYQHMLALNTWAGDFLPNMRPAQRAAFEKPKRSLSTRIAELLLRTPPGGWLERWEMTRKQARFSRQLTSFEGVLEGLNEPELYYEVAFSAQRCKGHFNMHGRRTMQNYGAHLERMAGGTDHN